MDTNTDTESKSSNESLLFSKDEMKDESYKSPESSDCEGYATPLATSQTDISGTKIRTNLKLNSGELTPRAVSPPVVKHLMFLEKPNILVMTQRELTDEEYHVQNSKVADDMDSSEEEFYDVADDHIRNVAQMLLNGLEEEERVATPIFPDDVDVESMYSEEEASTETFDDVTASEEEEEEGEDPGTEESGSTTPIQEENETEVIEEIIAEQPIEKESVMEIQIQEEVVEPCTIVPLEDPKVVSEVVADVVQEVAERVNEAEIDDEELVPVIAIETPVAVPVIDDVEMQPIAVEALEEVLEVSEAPEALEVALETEETEETPEPIENLSQLHQDTKDSVEVAKVLENVAVEVCKSSIPNMVEPEQSNVEVSEPQVLTPEVSEPAEVKIPEKIEEVQPASCLSTTEVSQKAETETDTNSTVLNPEAVETIAIVSPMMPTLVISDEVKTSQASAANVDGDDLSDCSIHEVKVDFDDVGGYSSGKEESLSSSTSSESFEFTETVSSSNSEERNQAIRDSINERYPTNDGSEDEDELNAVEFDDDLLAVKQISAEVEQLVAAINAFGRDEEQQMSAYLVGRNMAAEKKRKSAIDGNVSTSPCHDQLVQTDSDFILVDKHLPVVMENLQVEIDKLQSDLEKFKTGEKELLHINASLKKELDESQQTIDGIEVEAEQQYTELTSEIDELCEIVLKKDQDLAGLKERLANLSVSESNLRDDVESQKLIVHRQKEVIEGLREDLDTITKKLGEVTKLRDKAIEEATIYKMKNMERERFLSKEAQMSLEIEDLQRELNKQRLILNGTSMAKLADTFDRKVLHLENELRERDMLICKQNQIINSHRKSPTGSIMTTRKMQPRASVLAAAGNLPSAGSSSESFQNGLDVEAKEALLSFILSDRHNQLANIYNIGRILDLTSQEERAVERHLTKDRFT